MQNSNWIELWIVSRSLPLPMLDLASHSKCVRRPVNALQFDDCRIPCARAGPSKDAHSGRNAADTSARLNIINTESIRLSNKIEYVRNVAVWMLFRSRFDHYCTRLELNRKFHARHIRNYNLNITICSKSIRA